MQIILEVPDNFRAMGVTIIYGNDEYRIYSTSVTREEIVDSKVLLPREGAKEE